MACIMSTIVMIYSVSVTENRWAGAKCRDRLDLPWTPDLEPNPVDQREMRAICDGCTIRKQCALYALDGSAHGRAYHQAGGFYAGVWLPWTSTSDAKQANRRSARDALRRIVVPKVEFANA